MSDQEAKNIVELVIEELHNRGIISSDSYGEMTVETTEQIAEKVKSESEA